MGPTSSVCVKKASKTVAHDRATLPMAVFLSFSLQNTTLTLRGASEFTGFDSHGRRSHNPKSWVGAHFTICMQFWRVCVCYLAMTELRRDRLRQRWIVIAENCEKPPFCFEKSDGWEGLNSGPCAFCAGFEHETGQEICRMGDSREDNWHVRVTENKFPAVSMSFEALPDVDGACRLPAFGSHEVVIETPNHQLSLPDLPASHIAQVLKAYQARIDYFQKDSRFKFCQVFKNRGKSAGASMAHSHSQLIALPVVTHNLRAELQGSQEYYNDHKRCMLCDIVQFETEAQHIRLIDENEHFITVAPYAATVPYEAWLVPKRHSSNYETISDEEIQAMSKILKLTLRKIDQAFGCPPFNYTLQTAPLRKEHFNSPHFHWHLDIFPHRTTCGDFRLGSGCYFNPVAPEKAAEFLRNVEVEPL